MYTRKWTRAPSNECVNWAASCSIGQLPLQSPPRAHPHAARTEQSPPGPNTSSFLPLAETARAHTRARLCVRVSRACVRPVAGETAASQLFARLDGMAPTGSGLAVRGWAGRPSGPAPADLAACAPPAGRAGSDRRAARAFRVRPAAAHAPPPPVRRCRRAPAPAQREA
jgi:hypothetical protein